MIIRFFYYLFGFVKFGVFCPGISEGNFLRKSMKRHYIRTGNFPLVGQKFRLKSLPALSAEVDKVDILHLSLISGIWVEFKLTK